MKCNQCDSMTITMGSVTSFCHERGCPNTNKVYDPIEKEWNEPETDDYEYEEDDFYEVMDDYMPIE